MGTFSAKMTQKKGKGFKARVAHAVQTKSGYPPGSLPHEKYNQDKVLDHLGVFISDFPCFPFSMLICTILAWTPLLRGHNWMLLAHRS